MQVCTPHRNITCWYGMAKGRNGAHYMFLSDMIALYNVHDSIPFSKIDDDIDFLLNSLI